MGKLVTEGCYILFGSNILFVTLVYFLGALFAYFISKKLKYKSLFLFLVSVSPLLIFATRLLLNGNFLSDDFGHFEISAKYSYIEIFTKGIMADNLWAFHRLFTGFWLFKLVYGVFGANYNAFVLVNLALHLANSYLLLLLLEKITKNYYVRYICLFIFSSFYLTWISNIHELLALFFFLSTFLLVFNSKLKVLSILTFILGIYSKEIVFVFPICFLLFLVSYNNFVKKVDFRKYILELKPFLFILFVHLAIFVSDFIKFSSFDKGSGYDTVYKIGNLINHLSFYASDRIPILSGGVGLFLFILFIAFFDYYKKKLILTPLFLSFLALIFPVLLLSKSTSYYSYLPSMFLTIMIAVILSNLKRMNTIVAIMATAILIVVVFKLNIRMQENCFLIQYPRKWSN